MGIIVVGNKVLTLSNGNAINYVPSVPGVLYYEGNEHADVTGGRSLLDDFGTMTKETDHPIESKPKEGA